LTREEIAGEINSETRGAPSLQFSRQDQDKQTFQRIFAGSKYRTLGDLPCLID
jgi:hypothetical protein